MSSNQGRHPLKKTIAVLFILFLLASPCLAADPLTVTRCIDGDTLQLSNGEKVRLIGVDTPESKNNAKTRRDAKGTGQDIKKITEMGKEAVAFTRKLIEGKQVRLEYDVQKKDKYGRTLAYVFHDTGIREPGFKKDYWLVSTDHEGQRSDFINAELVLAGYAQVMTVPPNMKYQELFVTLQKTAKEKKRGLWASPLIGGSGEGITNDKRK